MQLTTGAKERKVPSSQFGRFWHFTGFPHRCFSKVYSQKVLQQAWVLEQYRKLLRDWFKVVNFEITRSITHPQKGKESPTSAVLSEANVKRLADGLARMRGAALKLGQMLSIQGNHFKFPKLLLSS